MSVSSQGNQKLYKVESIIVLLSLTTLVHQQLGWNSVTDYWLVTKFQTIHTNVSIDIFLTKSLVHELNYMGYYQRCCREGPFRIFPSRRFW